jgi:hypothetical protein
MKRWFVVALVAAAMALLPTTAAANEAHGDGQGNHFGPYSSTSPDSGTCGNDWANDTFKREFFVQQTALGTWRVTEAFIDGHFVTLVGPSPGACNTSAPPLGNGHLIAAGKVGTFGGFLSGTVAGGTYNPKGCKVAGADCSTTAGFITAVFGTGAAYNVTSFFFLYIARDQGLINRLWVNASDDLGGNRGDIATS